LRIGWREQTTSILGRPGSYLFWKRMKSRIMGRMKLQSQRERRRNPSTERMKGRPKES